MTRKVATSTNKKNNHVISKYSGNSKVIAFLQVCQERTEN
jgi:limonene-1,2-epoxide hydrolase